MDAKRLFRDGVMALRDDQDRARARQLLTESLRLDPQNEMAWLWLARTMDDRQKQLQCVERTLKINPNNEQAQKIRAKLMAQLGNASPFYDGASANGSEGHEAALAAAPVAVAWADGDAPRPPGKTMREPLTPNEEKRVAALLAKATAALNAEDVEGAIENWVYVLEIRVDHEIAIQNAVRYLARSSYLDDAKELLLRAVQAGTTAVPIYLTAIDVNRRTGDHAHADALREDVAKLPTADESVVVRMVDHFVEDGQPQRGLDLLTQVLEKRPDSAELLVKMGDLQTELLERRDEAARYYDRAARLKGGSRVGRKADRALSAYVPILTDTERGSVLGALRESLGVGALFLLMGWQDAGLNLLNMGGRWLGVLLSLIGGYLLITATSSPQQKPLAEWLGGQVPPPAPPPPTPKYGETPILRPGPVQEPTNLPIIPDWMRWLLGIIGVVVLVGAFLLVFDMSIDLLRNPVLPDIPSIEELLEGAVR